MVTINTALCSFGMSGMVFHAPFLHAHPGFNLYAVLERSSKAAAGIYPGIHSFDDLDAMLGDPNIDLVVVNTPNYTHYEFAKKALLKGKHVLVEKAFTVTVSEARDLIQVAREQGKLLSVYQNRRYDSDFKTLREVLQSGVLGEIVEANLHFERFKSALSAKKHKEQDIPGSGLLHDLGPHLIDQAIVLFGMPEKVFGHVRITRPLSKVNDHFELLLFYPSLTVRLRSSLLVKEALPAFSLHGTMGSFVKERGDVQEDQLKQGLKPGTPGFGTEPANLEGVLNTGSGATAERKAIPTLQGNYMEFYEQLYKALALGEALPVSAEDGLRVMQVLDAAERSNQSGCTQSISD